LSTTSNGELLETGGSLEISAHTKGLECTLKDGKPVRIAFRRNKETVGMETFLGEKTKNGVNWIPQTDVEIANCLKNPNTKTADDTLAANPESGLEDEMIDRERIREYLYSNLKSPPFLREFRMSGLCEMEIKTDEFGCFKSLCIGKSVHSLYDKALVLSLEKCPFPFVKGSEKKSFPFSIQIKNDFVNAFDHSPLCDKNYNQLLKEKQANQCVAPITINQSLANSIESIDQKIRTAGLGSLTNMEMGYYFINSIQLGLVNCDHFLPLNQPNTNLTVNVFSNKEPKVYLVFLDRKVVAQAQWQNNHWEFPNLPIGEKVRLISFSIDGDQPYLKSRDLEITRNGILNEDLNPVSKVSFKAEIEKMGYEFARL